MRHSTTDTYILKREILRFVGKLSYGLPKPDRKFAADITYGMLASGSCLLTDIVDTLHENIKKVNAVDRLSKHLLRPPAPSMLSHYLNTVKSMALSDPVIHIDDSDIIKPDGYHFEALGVVRDGSASTKDKSVFRKGYHVTEACVLTKSSHPVSIFSEIHSSAEKNFTSVNDITFSAIDRGISLFRHATFCMDRGYDDNKIFRKLSGSGQDFIIRIRRSRKVYYGNKFIPVTELCSRRKGKIKLSLFYRGKEHTAYLSHVKAKLTAEKKDVSIVLVYGISEHPMMLVTNKNIRSKEDVLRIAKTYFSRWRIEEYFRAKKQLFGFENFRVRKLVAINSLNFYLSVCMVFLARTSDRTDTDRLKTLLIKEAAPIRERVGFLHYRLEKGIRIVLSYANEGVRPWFRTKRPKYRQMCLKLQC